jgi:translation initiation factor 2 subunit 1
MLYTKDGFPEVDEIVKCTVKQISGGNTVFVHLDEYDKEGVLTISEIAPGRIRNLRDHVVENKTIVCKVLRVDSVQKRVDVSLRRVNLQQMKEKLDECKKEEYSDRIYQETANKLQIKKEELFEKTYEPIFNKYTTVFEALTDIMNSHEKIEMFKKLSKDQKKIFLDTINEKIKPEEVTLKKNFKLKSFESDGIEKIKIVLDKVLDKLKQKKLVVSYLSAEHYRVTITFNEIKLAAKILQNFQEELEKIGKDYGVTSSFEEQ